jgi:hypothetical protein
VISMKEMYVSPDLIDRERKRIREENPDITDTKIIEELIKAFGENGPRLVANYLNWYAQQQKEGKR